MVRSPGVGYTADSADHVLKRNAMIQNQHKKQDEKQSNNQTTKQPKQEIYHIRINSSNMRSGCNPKKGIVGLGPGPVQDDPMASKPLGRSNRWAPINQRANLSRANSYS